MPLWRFTNSQKEGIGSRSLGVWCFPARPRCKADNAPHVCYTVKMSSRVSLCILPAASSRQRAKSVRLSPPRFGGMMICASASILSLSEGGRSQNFERLRTPGDPAPEHAAWSLSIKRFSWKGSPMISIALSTSFWMTCFLL